MKRILTIIGARPQIIKAAAVSRAIRRHFRGQLEEYLLHTGQHYDDKMSAVFFEEMEIPMPDFHLSAGGKSHAAQTAEMLEGIEKILLEKKFDGVLVYGDTNSTLAGALAAAKIHIPVVHVEAGLRSFNKSMPEEINRITCDHCSTLLFSPTNTGIENLRREGFPIEAAGPYDRDRPGVFHCGDVMYDNSLYFSEVAERKTQLAFEAKENGFVLVTIHRPYNTDELSRLTALLEDLLQFGAESKLDLVIPLHPRTRVKLDAGNPELLARMQAAPNVHLTEPVSFLEMIYLEKRARLIVTDSGGVQKEAYFFKKPCVVVRTETEWVEIVETGCARLAFETGEPLQSALHAALKVKSDDYPPIFGDGTAAEFICQKMAEFL